MYAENTHTTTLFHIFLILRPPLFFWVCVLCVFLQTCSAAAGQGHLDVLRWARHNGCRWDAATPTSAAWGGHLYVLQYARENSCPWDEARVFEAARMKRHAHVLRWLQDTHSPNPIH